MEVPYTYFNRCMRKLWIGTHVLRFVAGHRNRIDALAFAILVKQERRNSLITNATRRKLKELFHMGSDKLKQVIEDGVKCSFLRWEGNNLIANKVCLQKGLGYMISRKLFLEAKFRNKNGLLTLSAVRTIIEEAIIVNQINMQNNCSDTHVRATEAKSVKTVRAAKKRESRMLNGKYCEDYVGLSNARIQALIGRSHGKASKAVKNAISHNLISKKVRIYETSIPGDSCTPVLRAAMRGTNIVIWVEMRCARLYLSNVYSYRGKNILKVNHGA